LELIVTGLAVLVVTPLLAGSDAFAVPRFDHTQQRAMLTKALPLAAALVLGHVYVRLVIPCPGTHLRGPHVDEFLFFVAEDFELA
jgi:hypothetical protein